MNVLKSRARHATTAVAAGLLTIAGSQIGAAASTASTEPTVIELTQTACQFVEPEGKDHGYTSGRKSDCVAVNDESGAKRLAAVEPLVLKPGKYVFRVTNQNVPYELGYYLRAANTLKIPFQPKVSGGGLKAGTTKDYEIALTAGEYIYSCPLNPTPDYPIIVRN